MIKHLTVYEVVTGFLHLYVSAGWVVSDTAFPVLQRPIAYALTINCQRDHMVSVETIIYDQSINQSITQIMCQSTSLATGSL